MSTASCDPRLRAACKFAWGVSRRPAKPPACEPDRGIALRSPCPGPEPANRALGTGPCGQVQLQIFNDSAEVRYIAVLPMSERSSLSGILMAANANQ